MKIVPGSYHDPGGFLFIRDENIYRQVNHVYREQFDLLIKSGLYDELAGAGYLVPHEEAGFAPAISHKSYKVIKPRRIPFVSYPYEWSFSQLKDAALLTLDIQKKALSKGMSLKDASAYNVQFMHGRPIFIDTLSFEKYEEGRPWPAYGQFCRHFLAPLALMSRTDIRLNLLLRPFIDGVPLDLASRLLPLSSWTSFSLVLHIHLHGHCCRKYATRDFCKERVNGSFSRKSFFALLDSLHSAVRRLAWNPGQTQWHDYYDGSNTYGEDGIRSKETIVSRFLDIISSSRVWDLGANTGHFSRIAASKGAFVVAWDSDPGCVETNYLKVRMQKEGNVLPLFLDLTNQSPAIGWENNECMSVADRGPTDSVLLLGLIHHLAIGHNVPFGRIAGWCARICNSLIVEFVPKDDPQVRKLLGTRKDIFPDYRRDIFESVFGKYFRTIESSEIKNTDRVLYLMERIPR